MKRILIIFLTAMSLFLNLSCAIFKKVPVPLELSERKVFSQNGEDGVIQKIFEIIKPTSRYAVEFGAIDGIKDSNTRNLVLYHGWSALMIEGVEYRANLLKENYKNIPQVRCVQAWVYPGNVEIIFEENGVPADLDFLSIDIDSNDYYVWKVIQNFRPKVVLIEYNASYPPPLKRVIEFHPMNSWDEKTDYFGASIQSLYELGKKKGYELIYVEKEGLNLFFVDKKYYGLFGITDNSPTKMYKPPSHGLDFGGRAPNGRGRIPFETYGDAEQVVETFRIKKKMVER